MEEETVDNIMMILMNGPEIGESDNIVYLALDNILMESHGISQPKTTFSNL